MALWVKALAAKTDGQLYSVSQMWGVERKIDSHKLSPDLQECCDTDSMSGSMHKHTHKIIHPTTKKNSSAGTFMQWKKTWEVIADHRANTQKTAKSCSSTVVNKSTAF